MPPRRPASLSIHRTSMLSKILFNLSNDIYSRNPLLSGCCEYFNGNVPEHGFFFVADEEKYIHPPDFSIVPASIIWETIKHDSSGIFCHRIGDTEGIGGYLVCATYLGPDRRKEEIAAGFLYSADKSKTGKVENFYFETLAKLKRFYSEFAASSIVDKFIGDESKFRYVVDLKDGSIASQFIPSPIESDDVMMQSQRIVSENLLRQIMAGKGGDENQLILDSRVREFRMSTFRICDCEYALLSFELTPSILDEGREYERVIANFSHKIKNKLTALGSAAEQLTLQKGKEVGEDDICLANVIHDVSENMDYMVGRLGQYCVAQQSEYTSFDLNDTIRRLISEEQLRLGRPAKVSFSPTEEFEPFTGDASRIEIALKELIDNAIEAADETGTVRISIKRGVEAVSVKISNNVAVPSHSLGTIGNEFAFEPFHSTKSDRAGMGIRIARKIIASHGGVLAIERNHENQFLATVELPLTSIRETVQ